MSKLLMISGFGSTHLERRGAAYHMLEEFSKHWERIDIITPGSKWGFRSTSERIFFGNVHVHSSPWPLIFQSWFIRSKGTQLYRQISFDCVTVQEFPPFYNGIGAYLLSRCIGIPYVLEIHHVPGYPKAAGFKEWCYRWALHWFIFWDAKPARAVRVVNNKQVPDFLMKAGVPRGKIRYFSSLYINFEKYHPGNSEKNRDLIFVSRLEKNKGIKLLLEAFEQVRRVKPDITMMVVGSGSMRSELVDFAARRGLLPSVTFTGWVSEDELVRAYQRAKIFVNPSYNEGGPRVAIEAMACGVPVITTRVGVMLDLIRDGENGLFADWVAKDLAEKILRLHNDQITQEKFSQAGRILAQQFQKDRVIELFADWLKSIR